MGGSSHHWKAFIFTLMCVFGYVEAAPPEEVLIGALFSSSSSDPMVRRALKLAVDYVNNNTDILPLTRMKYISNDTSDLRTPMENIQNACYQVQKGVVAVVGPATTTAIKATYPVLQGTHIPQMSPFATDPMLSTHSDDYEYLLKMSAPDVLQSNAIASLVKAFGWSRFAIIASLSDYGRNGLGAFQTTASSNDWNVASVNYFYPVTNVTNLNVKSLLLEIKNKGVRVVLLNCLAPHARIVLDQAARLHMTLPGWAWIVTDGVTSIAGFYDQCTEVPLHLRGILGIRPAVGKGALYSDFLDRWMKDKDNLKLEVGNTTTDELSVTSDPLSSSDCRNGTACEQGVIKADCQRCPQALIGAYAMRTFDSVLAIAYGLDDYFNAGHNLTAPMYGDEVCHQKIPTAWGNGELLRDYIKSASGDGVMNYLNFTSLRTPGVVEYDVVNLQDSGWFKLGSWTPEDGGTLNFSTRDIIWPGDTRQTPVDSSMDMSNVTLKFVTILEEPFTMETTEKEREMNPKQLYKGYCVDMLVKLQELLKFDYTLQVVADGNYGGQDPETGQWNGMVGEVLSGAGDVVLAPLTITYERQQVVAFTKPFMDLGLTIMVSRESSQTTLFSFMQPFEGLLWVAVLAGLIVCAFATTLCSWISPFGYRGFYTQRLSLSEKKGRDLRSILNLWDSLWYSFSCWVQQGADVSPRCFSGRVIHGVWWFAVMIILATYTANLAAVLTVKRLETGINSLEDLANQRDIKYGTVENSAPLKFFQEQVSEPYTKMYGFMQQERSSVTNSSQGIQWVQDSYGKTKGSNLAFMVSNTPKRRDDEGEKGRYAFIFDSAPLEYIANKAPCTSLTVGRIFNHFGYGIAMQKMSPYLSAFSLEVLKLRQSGYLESLQTKWISGGVCSTDNDTPSGGQATFGSVAGVFLVLLPAGVGLALLIVLCECCAACHIDAKRSSKNKDLPKTSFCGALHRRVSRTCTDLAFSCGAFCGCPDGSDSEDDSDAACSSHCAKCGPSDNADNEKSKRFVYANDITMDDAVVREENIEKSHGIV